MWPNRFPKDADNTNPTVTLSRHTRVPQHASGSAPGARAANEVIANEKGIMVSMLASCNKY